MKLVLTFLAFALTLPLMGCTPTGATITPQEAAAHAGETVTVEGEVSGVGMSKKGAIFINFGGKYPNQTFTAYVPSSAGLDPNDLKGLSGKKVRVTGKIGSYKGKPQIVVIKRSQIES